MRRRRWSESEFGGVLLDGRSAAWVNVRSLVARVAPTDANVVMLGEAGTGKEYIARAIHALSAQRGAPFLTVRHEQLQPAEWGQVLAGMYSGTIFLEDSGDVSLDLRHKLAEALDANVHLVLAIDGPFSAMMQERRFGVDLIPRLKLFPITAPAVRSYTADLPVIVHSLVKIHASKQRKRIDLIPPETMLAIEGWRWPGNLVELEDFLQRAVQLTKGRTLAAPVAELVADSMEPRVRGTLEEVERDYILQMLRECGGVVTNAAVRLGMPRTTLNARILKLHISRQEI